jgi:hypothetical protein
MPSKDKHSPDSAGCALAAHLAESVHNPLKSHQPTERHIAAFYPAIARLVVLLRLLVLPNVRWDATGCEGSR